MTDLIYEACKALRSALIARMPKDGLNVAGDEIIIDPVRGKVRVSTGADRGWVEEAINDALPEIKRILNGKVTKEDEQKVIKKYGKFRKARAAGAGRTEK